MMSNPLVSRTLRCLISGASIALVMALMTAGGCKKKYVAPPMSPATPEEIKEFVQMLGGKKRAAGMGIKDVRVMAATRLADIGPAAKEYGAIPALEKLAGDPDPEAKEAAQAALAKIKGP
jgi:hypothetical protein